MDLQKQKEVLEALKLELTDRAARLDAHQRRQTQDMSQDWEDRATQMENDEVIDELDDLAHERLEQVIVALDRIEAGSYEYCAKCDEPIGEKRLEVIPEATECVQCHA